jgi:acetyl esterase/lipase
MSIVFTIALSFAASAIRGEGPKDTAADDGAVVKEDVVYGRVHGAALVADIALPSGNGPFPAIVSVHGGRWVGGSKTDPSTIKVAQWAELGFFAMSIDYRLTGCTPAPACYQDLLCAVRWLHAHAKTYQIDRARIFLVGQSAGGHLVSLAATLGDGPFAKTGGWDDQPSDFRAAISVAAPYDLVSLDWGKYWAPAGVEQEAAAREASPIEHVAAKNKPLLIIHSDDDRSVPVQQAIDMAAKLEVANAKVEFRHYKDKGHMGITELVIQESLAFIKHVSP